LIFAMNQPPAQRRSLPRRLARIALRVVLLGVAWFLIHTGVVCYVGYADDTRPCDVGVVLGNFVALDGTPGLVVKGRLDRAVELYRAGAFAHVIVSGATAPGGYDEARGMKRYLIEHGIPADTILADPHGTNTYLTALNTRAALREHGWSSPMVISQYYHVLRCRLAFHRMGIAGVRSAHAPEGRELREPYILFREFVAFYWYLIRPYPG
jgi:vancomycin permeability regulator SanA